MVYSRSIILTIFLLTAGLLSLPVSADLQSVEIGGSLEISGNWYSPFTEPEDEIERIPPVLLPFRPIGTASTFSEVRGNHKGNSLSYVEQRLRLYVRAAFTDRVSTFIELDSIDNWGEDFRSPDYRTGADLRASSIDDVEVYQAYIEAEEMFGVPLHLRLGRQEMFFGSGWLVGTHPEPDPFTGQSFDALRLTYFGDAWALDAWWSKLAERFALEEDGDVDFYGLYFSYLGIEDVEFDLYWMLMHDGTAVEATLLPWYYERLEDALGLDNYNDTHLNTIGVRSSGARGPVDWEAEIAYQFGEAGAVGVQFAPVLYGDEDAAWDTWAANLEVGYTFDVPWEPRVYAGTGYYDGEDNRAISFRQWLTPFREPRSSVSFNRLFSDFEMDAFLDDFIMSNAWYARIGVEAAPTDSVNCGFDLCHPEVIDPFDWPVYVSLGLLRLPIAPALSFWDQESSKDLGWQTSLWADYHYTEDIHFEVGWSHYFVGKGVKDGSFINDGGLGFIGGVDDDDVDYVYFLALIEFGRIHPEEYARHRFQWPY